MPSKIQDLYEVRKAKTEQIVALGGLGDDEIEELILELIVFDKALMCEPATCIADVGVLARVATYWRDEGDLTTLNGFDYAVANAAANLIKTE